MLRLLLNKNKRAIKSGFILTSIIFTLIALVLLTVGFLKGQIPSLKLFLAIIIGFSAGFPAVFTSIVILRIWWDHFIAMRNFSSFPFDDLMSIRFKKMTKNENNKWHFTSEFYTGMINDFIVDCDVDTQNDHNRIRFKFYTNHKPMDKAELDQFQNALANADGSMNFNTITKKFHFKNHKLKSILDLKTELINFAKIIESKNIIPSEVAWR
jgi:hypothetical protein